MCISGSGFRVQGLGFRAEIGYTVLSVSDFTRMEDVKYLLAQLDEC